MNFHPQWDENSSSLSSRFFSTLPCKAKNLLQVSLRCTQTIYRRMEDPIPWGQDIPLISNIHEAEALADYRFRKQDLGKSVDGCRGFLKLIGRFPAPSSGVLLPFACVSASCGGGEVELRRVEKKSKKKR
jgi:hypothetical protein